MIKNGNIIAINTYKQGPWDDGDIISGYRMIIYDNIIHLVGCSYICVLVVGAMKPTIIGW